MSYEFLGFSLAILATAGIGAGLISSPRNPFPARLIAAALAARIVGCLARYDMMVSFYGGVADAARYFHAGQRIASRAWNLDPALFSLTFWMGGDGRWWGTPFMEKLAGVVMTFVGPTWRGNYLAFSLLSFLGLYMVALTVHRINPGRRSLHFAGWIWLWPSLWFWPSSIGKESITILAIGLAFFGYAGRSGSTRWVPFLAGVALAFALRPHVAAVLCLSAAGAYWLGSWKRPRPRVLLEGVLAAALAYGTVLGMGALFGLDRIDLEGAEEFITWRGHDSMMGGSSLEALPSGPLAPLMGFVNIWMRPFLWEAHHVMALFSAIEILFLWGLAWRWRKSLRWTLKAWRTNRLLAFSIFFLAGYTLITGLTFGNLGIIARQRTPMIPFALMLVTAAPVILANQRRPAAGRRPLRHTRLAAKSLSAPGPYLRRLPQALETSRSNRPSNELRTGNSRRRAPDQPSGRDA